MTSGPGPDTAATGAPHPADVLGAIPPAPAPRGRALTDRGALAVAVAVVAGAWWHADLPLVVGLAAAATALVVRHPRLLVAAGFLLASALGHRAVAGLDPVAPDPYAGPVVLLADPVETPFGIRVDVRVGARRLELEATDGAAGTVGTALAGERLRVEGRLRPPPPDAPWLVPRHVVGRLSVAHAERLDGGSAPWRAANRFRRLLGRGAEVLPEPTRSLYGGFVLGDDRGQPPEVVDDFRGAGLSHLLVVSGQNVAFVLVIVSPVTGRLGLGWRWVVTVGVIAAFGVVTRFEPSVLRASAMAALGVTAALAGRPSGSLRVLALAVAGLVLVDPLLVFSVGFQLSVLASLGIALLGPWLVARVRGPRWWREAVGVTVAAQLGVAPVLVPRFGGMPVVSLVANVVAVPVAGLVTTWGLPAGVVAGFGGRGVARVVHGPTRLLIGWVAGVARVAAGVPLGEVGVREVLLSVGAGWAAVVLGRRWSAQRWARRLRWGCAALVVGALLAPALVLRSPPAVQPVGDGVVVHRGGGATVVVLAGRVSPRAAMEGLRRAGVRRIDALVAPKAPDPELLAALRHRWSVRHVLTPAQEVRVRLGALVVDTSRDPPVVEPAAAG